MDGSTYFLPNLTQCLLFVGQPDGTLVDESEDSDPQVRGTVCQRAGEPALRTYEGDGDLDLFITKEGAQGLPCGINDAATAGSTDVTPRTRA